MLGRGGAEDYVLKEPGVRKFSGLNIEKLAPGRSPAKCQHSALNSMNAKSPTRNALDFRVPILFEVSAFQTKRAVGFAALGTTAAALTVWSPDTQADGCLVAFGSNRSVRFV